MSPTEIVIYVLFSDPRLRNQLEQFKKQNVAMAKDNSRLKTEKYHLTSAIHKLHHQE